MRVKRVSIIPTSAGFGLVRLLQTVQKFIEGKIVGVADLREGGFDDAAVFVGVGVIPIGIKFPLIGFPLGYVPYPRIPAVGGFGSALLSGGVDPSTGAYTGCPLMIPTCFMFGTAGAGAL